MLFKWVEDHSKLNVEVSTPSNYKPLHRKAGWLSQLCGVVACIQHSNANANTVLEKHCINNDYMYMYIFLTINYTYLLTSVSSSEPALDFLELLPTTGS